MNGRDVVLQAFDRLFDKAAAKLQVACSDEDKFEARRNFVERSSDALEVISRMAMPAMPEEIMRRMEEAIDQLSPSQLVGYLATIPLAHQAQEMMRQLTFRVAEQRLVQHLIEQADDQYGGN